MDLERKFQQVVHSIGEREAAGDEQRALPEESAWIQPEPKASALLSYAVD